jgi:2-amino-4-hydroxy-6-hydroxymethyldihydropteridine diphosphokinase
MVDPQMAPSATRLSELDRMAVIALGSNLSGAYPTCEALLEAALLAMADCGIAVEARSSWWRSSAWPDSSRPAYVNGIALAAAIVPPRELLQTLRTVEAAFGRVREAANADRTLDLDLIAHGRTCMREPGLVLPHPRAAGRLFVMGPLAEIAPLWRHPQSGEMAQVLAQRAAVGADARPLPADHAALHNGAGNAI